MDLLLRLLGGVNALSLGVGCGRRGSYGLFLGSYEDSEEQLADC